jgi:hypothetical protein
MKEKRNRAKLGYGALEKLFLLFTAGLAVIAALCFLGVIR